MTANRLAWAGARRTGLRELGELMSLGGVNLGGGGDLERFEVGFGHGFKARGERHVS